MLTIILAAWVGCGYVGTGMASGTFKRELGAAPPRPLVWMTFLAGPCGMIGGLLYLAEHKDFRRFDWMWWRA